MIMCRLHFMWKLNECCQSSGAGQRRKCLIVQFPLAGETARGDKETCVCANKAWASSLKDAFVTPKLEIGDLCGQKQQRGKGRKLIITTTAYARCVFI